MSHELPCLVCRKPLQPVKTPPETGVVNQPWDANVFHSYGHYGATVFDASDGSFLEVNVCSACLLKAAQDGAVFLGTPSPAPSPPPTMGLWNPEKEETT